MQVIVNGRPLEDTTLRANNVEGLLNVLREDGDCLVVGLRFNEREVADGELFPLMQTPLTQGGTLEIETDSARRLAGQVLSDVAEGLRQSRPGLVKVAELVAAGKKPEAMAHLSECLSAWNAVEQSLQTVTSLAKLDLTAAGPSAPSAQELLFRLREQLGRIQQYLQADDLVALADLVEYDMPPLSQQWEAALERLRQSLQ